MTKGSPLFDKKGKHEALLHWVLLCPLNITPHHMETNCTQWKRRTLAHCASELEAEWTFWGLAQNLNSQDKLSCRLWDMNVQRSQTGSTDQSHTLSLFLTASSLSDFSPLPVSETRGHGFIWLRHSAVQGHWPSELSLCGRWPSLAPFSIFCTTHPYTKG